MTAKILATASISVPVGVTERLCTTIFLAHGQIDGGDSGKYIGRPKEAAVQQLNPRQRVLVVAFDIEDTQHGRLLLKHRQRCLAVTHGKHDPISGIMMVDGLSCGPLEQGYCAILKLFGA